MNAETLLDLARHQAWADAAHWKALHDNPALLADAEIRARLNHMLMAEKRLTTLARGEAPQLGIVPDIESMEELEAALQAAQADLTRALQTCDLEKSIPLPRGPKGPFDAPAGVLLLQAITHSQHHRGQNASRMRQPGVTPPMTDYIVWFANGRP